MREIMNVSSLYDAKSRVTTVQVSVGKRNCLNKLVYDDSYFGEAKWNKNDKFDANEGFRVAYERALSQIPKENIIEKCAGLKDGDWVCVQPKESDDKWWGIVSHNNILYVIGHDNWDRVSSYSNGETNWYRITTIVRPTGSSPITIADIRKGRYKNLDYKDGCCKIYTAD